MLTKERVSRMIEKEMKEWIWLLCQKAGVDEAFRDIFLDKLSQSPEIYKELFYFACHQNFLCEYKIQNISVVDILVWQIDHFKAGMDRGNYDMKYNQNKMVLMAFDTFLNMEKKPEKYVNAMQTETGTDYPDKF